MLDRQPMLSIFVPTYNHEKYIKEALDGILMQKTQYSFEVLVGDDASPDATGSILKEYEKKYPGKFTVFYREQNMYHAPCSNSLDLKLRCKGKYILCLEGDDFWTDENKLEKQITFLEEHPECSAVAHNCVVVDDDSKPSGEQYPECKDSEYTFDHFFAGLLPGQTTTFMCRNYMVDETIDNSLIMQMLTPGDRVLVFMMLCYGKIHCMQETMSAYRYVTTHGTSYSANKKFNYPYEKKYYRALADYARLHSTRTVANQAEYLCLSTIIQGLHTRTISLGVAVKDFLDLHDKTGVIAVGVKRFMKKLCR